METALGVENSENAGENPKKMGGNTRVVCVASRSYHMARSGLLTIRGPGGVLLIYIQYIYVVSKLGLAPTKFKIDSNPNNGSINENRGKKAKWASKQ